MKNSSYEKVKQLALICAGALFSIVPLLFADLNTLQQLKWLLFAFASVLILIGFGIFDPVFECAVRCLRSLLNITGVLAFYSIQNNVNSSWVGLTLESVCKLVETGLSKKVLQIKNFNMMSLFKVVVNPYGGVYPEQDISTLASFNKILDYVKNGGVFISIADIPFYYAFDERLKRMVDTTPMAKVSTTMPIRSFYDTLISEKLKNYVFGIEPNETDGNNNIARVFILAKTTTNLYHKSYRLPSGEGMEYNCSPAVAIPYGKGFFVFSSIEINQTNTGLLIDILKTTANLFL